MTQPTILNPPTTGTNWTPPGWVPPTEPPAPPAPPAKRKTGWYIAGAIILFFVIIGLANGDDTENASSSGGAITTPTTASSSGSARSSLLSWVTLHGSDDAATLSADLTSISAAADATDVVRLGSACRTFQRHLATATAHLPTPDAQLTRHLGDAYGYFSQATAACISGTADLDPAALSQVATYMSLGSGSLSKATARVETLN